MPKHQTPFHQFLLDQLPRDLVLGVEDALVAGADRAARAACDLDAGHKPHALGQLRHFHMNEAFHSLLAAQGVESGPIRGNELVTARSGLLNIGRFNINRNDWRGGRRSAGRVALASVNRWLDALVHPDLFEDTLPPAEATVFFVALFAGSISDDAPRALVDPDRCTGYGDERVAAPGVAVGISRQI